MGLDRSPDRRGFFRDSLKALGRFVAETVQEAISDQVAKASGGQRYLRPPGAIDEAAFLLTCTRCGDCVSACPVQAIRLLPPTAGAAVSTPYIDPSLQACDLCGKCMPACEVRALLPIEEPHQVRMGLAAIDTGACWAYKGSICDLCYQRCPFPDEAIRMVEGKPHIISDACTGCGQCAYVCVSTPVAITIAPRN